MNFRIAWAMSLLLLGRHLAPQEQVWVFQPPTIAIGDVQPMGDYDGDGANDVLVVIVDVPISSVYVEILSGRTGAPLYVMPNTLYPLRSAVGCGDMDQDGYLDFAFAHTLGNGQTQSVTIWSAGQNRPLWTVTGTWNGLFGDIKLGNLDTDGDGHLDFIVATVHPNESDLYVYNNTGQLQYMIPMRQYGWIVRSLAKYGDFDGDGCDDFLVGAIQPMPSTTGAVALVSGRTGAILRITRGLPGEGLGENVAMIGDLDGDGIPDYAVADQGLHVRFYSGATGGEMARYPGFAGALAGNFDGDLDGVPDVFFGSDDLLNPTTFGRTRLVSGRDFSVLWTVQNTYGHIGWAVKGVAIGPVPGSPYPLIAWWDRNFLHSPGFGRIRAFRCNPLGVGPVLGTECSSLAVDPQIAIRPIATGCRATLSGAPPGALASLVVALRSQTSSGGLSVPFALSPLGFPGCTVYVPPVTSTLRFVGTVGQDRGYTSVDMPFSISPSTTGTLLAAQWLVLDPVNFDYAATARHEFRAQ